MHAERRSVTSHAARNGVLTRGAGLLVQHCLAAQLLHQRHRPLRPALTLAKPQLHSVSAAEARPEMLYRAKAAEAARAHDADARAQGLALAHGVGGQDDAAGAAGALQRRHRIPKAALGDGIHAAVQCDAGRAARHTGSSMVQCDARDATTASDCSA
jgi:hypothetical protein